MKRIEWLRIPTLVCLLALLALAPGAAGAQAGPVPGEEPAAPQHEALQLDGDGPWVVRVQTVDREVIRALAQWADVWSVYRKKGYTLVQVDRAEADRCSAATTGRR